MSAILLILAGIVIGGWAAKANTMPAAQRPAVLQGSFGAIVQFVCQFGGLGLLIWGVVKLFS